MAAGNRMGMNLREEDAIRWLTINPAKALGIDQQTGSLEPGKMADVVVWSGNPFSVYSRARQGLHRRRPGLRPQRSRPPAGDGLRARHPGRREEVQP